MTRSLDSILLSDTTDYDLFQSSISVSLLAVIVGLLVLHLYATFSSQENRREPPGPKPLPLLGNLLQLDLKRPHRTLFQLSKKYGPVFTVHFGPKKVVVLAGHKMIKQALVKHEDFSEREHFPIIDDLKLTHGIVFANGDSWKEMRRFALTTMKGFGMGKKACEEKITVEGQRLIDVIKEKDGKAFDTTQLVNCAVSNIICSIVYGNRFEYDDPEFRSMVDRANKNTQILGSASVRLYNYFPRLFKWLGARKQLMKSALDNRRQMTELIKGLHDTLNPQMCRGLVDSFLAHKKDLESSISVSLLAVIVGLLVLHLYATFSSQENRREPPGPKPLPLLGNLLQLDLKRPHRTLFQLSKKYGPVFTVHFGPKKVVVLAGHKMIKQALVKHEDFSEREHFPIIDDLKLTHGIVFANGDSWKEMRRFALTTMKGFGMGKKACEEKITVEGQRLIDVIKEKDGKAFDTTQLVNCAVSNIICSIVYGNRFEYDDPEFRSMVDRANKNTQILGSASVRLYNYFPRLFKWLGARKQLMKSALDNRRQMTELIKGLHDTLNPQMCRGLVDSFLAHKKDLEASGNMKSHYTEDNLLVTVVNLFTAGSDTTSSTIRYGLLFMAKYPKIQDQVQEELSRVVGSRQVQMEDRKNLPYTDAVIHEIQRMANVVPTILHRTSGDVLFQGYFIKKGTPVLVLLSSALQDEDEWEKPYTFNPAHFLDKEGKFRKREAFLPFSAGLRVCAGESLARMELFLFFTSLLHNFRFTPPPGVTEDELDLTPVVGFTLTPSPHQLCAISSEKQLN
ncbi:cytochrome P450 2K1-like [Enoplosus armatus]|uniref:cytochrome P450 2K1-like n=1 Tax=Enoplosus armatus TaxID=215367 RepID=UPI0039911993